MKKEIPDPGEGAPIKYVGNQIEDSEQPVENKGAPDAENSSGIKHEQKESAGTSSRKSHVNARYNHANSFPIVGIGASAGGLEALECLFKNIPDKVRIAFVVIQHLDPKHKSIMGSLLKKDTKLKIIEPEDGQKIEPGCIYLNPPSKFVSIMRRTLLLLNPMEVYGVRLSIDHFFRSLSEDQGEKSIGIILSGTGSDGTQGIKAIKAAGGMVMVQDEKQAKYSGMPRSAIDTGAVDFILPVEMMPGELLKYVRHPYIGSLEKVSSTPEKVDNYIQKIFFLIRSITGHDFSDYKLATIYRRVDRRMAIHQLERISEYVHYLQRTPAEVEILFKDFLIGVTSFFRDPEAFKALQEDILPDYLIRKDPGKPVRVWIPGCATGEEAYSIAIILVEVMEKIKKHFTLQIFASEIDSEAIERARAGIYPESIIADVSEKRLKRFFKKEHNTFRINKNIREIVVFATQDLIKDPPFSKLDLISCRNLLIYMDPVLQKKIIPLFHYTLFFLR
jgi:two-component system CheB/CheR fusion protein